MSKTTLLLMAISLLSKILGFLRNSVLSYFYGASSITDAYILAQSIPSGLLDFIGTGLFVSFVPVFNKIQKKDRKNFLDVVLSDILIIGLVLFIIGYLFMPTFLKILAPGFDSNVFDTTLMFSQIIMITVLFTGLSYLQKSYLNIQNTFVSVSFLGLPINLIIILAIIMSYYFNNILFLPIGIVVSALFEEICLWFMTKRKGINFKFKLDFHNQEINAMLVLALPMIISICANQINLFIDKSLASYTTSGGITQLEYGNTFYYFVYSVFILPVLTVMYPKLANKLSEKEDYIAIIEDSLEKICFFVFPSVCGLMLFSEEIITFMFGSGKLESNQISVIAMIMNLYSIGYIAIAFKETFTRIYYVNSNTRIPIKNTIICVLVNILLDFLLIFKLDVYGLPLATSLALFISDYVLYQDLKNNYYRISKKLKLTLFIISLSSLGMAVCSIFIKNMNISSSLFFNLFFQIMITGSIYFLFMLLLKYIIKRYGGNKIR